ncbi:MAG TPA: hypothetical protein VGU43_06665 [Thermoplasmata archaeon]|nr:hypothetical protein [Thermoplasmata archaeon]
MGRTVREIATGDEPPELVARQVDRWLAQHGFNVLLRAADGSEQTLPRWDGDMVLHPKPGALVALLSVTGGAAIVFEIGLPGVAGASPLQVAGYVTSRGPGWKGKEYDLTPSGVAVATLPRRKGLELLEDLVRSVGSATGSAPALDAPLASAAPSLTSLGARSYSLAPAQAYAPVPSGGASPAAAPSGGSSSEALPGKVRPYRWSDRTLASKTFPFTYSTSLPPMTALRLQAQLSRVLDSIGFPMIYSALPMFDGKPEKVDRFNRHRGLVVGERHLRLDLALRQRARNTGIGVGLGAAAIAGGLVYLVATGYHGPLLLGAAPLGILIAIALGSVTSRGSFDSEIVWVEYAAASPPVEQLTDSGQTVQFDLRIGAGTVASQNWAGKYSSGRNLKAFRAPNPELSGVPRDLSTRLAAALQASP